MSLHDLIQTHLLMTGSPTLRFTWGELTQYDPKTHSGKFHLPIHLDDNTGRPIETNFIPIGTPITGIGYGMQFQVEAGMQALIVFVDKDIPICACFTFNQIDTPPFTDGLTNGWKDKTGNLVTTDSNGNARLVGTTRTELGGSSLPDGDQVLRKKDLQPIVNLLNDLIGKYNNHTHAGHAVVSPATAGDNENETGSAALPAGSSKVYSND